METCVGYCVGLLNKHQEPHCAFIFWGPNGGWLCSVSHGALHASTLVSVGRRKKKRKQNPPRFPVETGLIIPISGAGDCLSRRELCLQCPVSRERRTCDSLCLIRPSLNPGVPELLFPTDCVSQGCHTRLPEIRWVWTIETYSLMVLQATSPSRASWEAASGGFWRTWAFHLLLHGPLPCIFLSISSRGTGSQSRMNTSPGQQSCRYCHSCEDPGLPIEVIVSSHNSAH